MLNFKYIKEHSKPGSWRRGYEYHLKKQVLETVLEDNIVHGKVKGNFKDFYSTDITFDGDNITAKCDCPLEEEWCKHAVAVGLKAVEKHLHEEYLTNTTGEEFQFTDENVTEIPEKQGNYRFLFDPSRRQKFFSIQVFDRSKNEIVTDIEAILRVVLELQKNGAKFDLNSAQKVEFGILQQLLKNGMLDKKSKFYDIQINKFETIFQLLSRAEDVLDAKSQKKLGFLISPWELTLTVNVSIVGNVLLSLHWKRSDKDEVYPFEEVRYFSRHLKWGRYKNLIFPTNTAVSVVPPYLTKSTFTDIRDADGGKFVYEELPKLKKLMNVEISEVLEKLMLERKPPINVVKLSLDENDEVKASLEFDYDGEIVPYSKLAKNTPFVTIKRPKEDLIYWVKRNSKSEDQAFQMLESCKFMPTQTNNFAMDLDTAIDFYNFYMDKAGENWRFEAEELSRLQLYKKPLELVADIDFSADTTDSFEINFYAKCEKEVIEFEELNSLISQGKKYLYAKDKGYLEIPVTKLFSLSKALITYDVFRNDENAFLVKTFRAGLIAELQEEGFTLKMSRKFSNFWKQISTFSTLAEVTLPKGINATLRDYQVKGFNWLWFLYTYGLNGILADDMGLGKTLQTLTLIQKAKEKDGKRPSLVICPTSVVFNWESEIAKFAPKMSILNLTGSERSQHYNKIDDADVVITSYALIRRDIDKLKEFDFRFLILDESQNIKNSDSQTSQATKNLSAQHKIALSGTPIENNLFELWSVFDFLMPGFLFDTNEFNYRFVAPIMDRSDKTVEHRLKMQVYPFILRRMKRDVAKDLPEKTESIAYCQLTSEQKDFYLETLDSTKEELFKTIEQNGIAKSKMSIFAALLRLRQICCHPHLYDKENQKGIESSGKFEHLKEMLEEIISEGHRVLLFSQFVSMLDIVKDWLASKGIKHEYLTGSTKDRRDVVERFNNDDSIPIFLISLKAGGTGLNLTGADYVIHYDPWWNPAVEDQATDRAYRIGQTKKVFVYRLITKGTVEEKIQKLKERKRNLVDSIISVDRDIEKSLTYEDLKDILSPDL